MPAVTDFSPAGLLREKGLPMNLIAESGLSADDFPKIQKAIVALRNNLIKAAQGTDQTSAKAER